MRKRGFAAGVTHVRRVDSLLTLCKTICRLGLLGRHRCVMRLALLHLLLVPRQPLAHRFQHRGRVGGALAMILRRSSEATLVRNNRFIVRTLCVQVLRTLRCMRCSSGGKMFNRRRFLGV